MQRGSRYLFRGGLKLGWLGRWVPVRSFKFFRDPSRELHCNARKFGYCSWYVCRLVFCGSFLWPFVDVFGPNLLRAVCGTLERWWLRSTAVVVNVIYKQGFVLAAMRFLCLLVVRESLRPAS